MASSTLGRWPLHGAARLRGLIPRPLGGDANTLERVIGDYVFGLDDVPAPAELATSRIPDAAGGFRWVLTWRTDVIEARDGSEQRIATLTNPRHRFEGSFLLDDADTRTVRQLLHAGASGTYDLPLTHEAVAAIVTLAGGTIFISADAASKADWIAPGRRVYVRGPSGSAYTTTITGASGGTINVASSPPVGGYFPAYHTLIFPTETIRFEDGQPLARYPVNAARWSFGGRAAARALGGAGAPAATTHDGMRVLDRRPFQEREAAEAFPAGVEFLDNGATMTSATSWARAKHRRHGFWRIDNPSDRQWWKAFLEDRRGRWKPFLFPTWRPDLVLYEQPSAGSAYVRVTTDYINGWFPSFAHRRLQIEYADRSVTHHTVHSTLQASGYQEITLYETLANPIPTGGVTRVSFLETARLDTDEVQIEVGSGWKGRIELPSVVVQEAPTHTNAWPDTAAKLRTAFGYGTWASAWLCDEQLGDLVDAFGGVTLGAVSTPTYRQVGAFSGDYAVGFDSSGDHFDAPSTSTFDLSNGTALAFFLCWKGATPTGTDYLFHKGVGAVLFQGFITSAGYLTAAIWDGTTLLMANVAVNHVDGAYHDCLLVFDRASQKMRSFSDLGSSSEVDISSLGSVSNAGTWRLGGTDPNRGTCAFAAVATADVAALRANATTALANVRRYTGRA